MKAILLTPLLWVACAGAGSETPPSMPEGYRYDNRTEVGLERELEEISGIEYVAGQGFLAHNDEEGIVYRLNAEFRITDAFPFAGEGDYEEIKKVGDDLYVLSSKGDVWSMKYDGAGIGESSRHEWPGKKAEFEAMIYDGTSRQLILICKNSKEGKQARISPGYGFDPETGQFSAEALFSLDWDSVEKVAGKELKNLHPSAAAVHPLTKEIYLLASIEKLLLVLSPDGAIQSAHPLDKNRFPQPEGITFDEKGHMYISNEAADTDQATVLTFPYQNPR